MGPILGRVTACLPPFPAIPSALVYPPQCALVYPPQCVGPQWAPKTSSEIGEGPKGTEKDEVFRRPQGSGNNALLPGAQSRPETSAQLCSRARIPCAGQSGSRTNCSSSSKKGPGCECRRKGNENSYTFPTGAASAAQGPVKAPVLGGSAVGNPQRPGWTPGAAWGSRISGRSRQRWP